MNNSDEVFQNYSFSPIVVESLAQSNQRIIVTGAGGWLGLATLHLIANAIGEHWTERVACFGSSHRVLTLQDGRSIIQCPLEELENLDFRPSLLLHLAFLTKDRVSEMDEAEYRSANRKLAHIVHSALNRIGVNGIFIASSGAAYSANNNDAAHDMQVYGQLKLDDERLFNDWAESEGKTAVITRIFNVAGPYINKHQTYALASFIRDALAKRPIAIRASHRVVRGFVAIRELMSLVFALLLADGSGIWHFDTGGEAMELAELAEAVAVAIGPVPVERASIQSDQTDYYVGDKQPYNLLLKKYGVQSVPLIEQIYETSQFLITGP